MKFGAITSIVGAIAIFLSSALSAAPNTPFVSEDVRSLAGKCFRVLVQQDRFGDIYMSEARLSAQRGIERSVNAYFHPTDIGEYVLFFSDNPSGTNDLGLGFGYLGHTRGFGGRTDSNVEPVGRTPYTQRDFVFRVTDVPSPSENTVVTFQSLRELERGRPSFLSGNLGGFIYMDPLTGELADRQEFELVPIGANEPCMSYPEMQQPTVDLAFSGDTNALENSGSSIRGWIDGHNHLTSYEGFGGRLIHGAAFAIGGPAEALQDSVIAHGDQGRLDLVGSALSGAGGGFLSGSGTEGWPTFRDWPYAQSVSHGQYYYLWIKRAYYSGQRMMVVDITENEVFCEGLGVIRRFARGFGSALETNNALLSTFLAGAATALTFFVGRDFDQNVYECDVTDRIQRQVATLRNLERYIEAQSGTTGGGFFKIVTSPSEARTVIAQGKLAVVIGVELSETLSCGVRDAVCTPQIVDDRLDELYDLGIRSLFPIHKFDNQFGGVHLDSAYVSFGNRISSREFFNTEACEEGVISNENLDGPPSIPITDELSVPPNILRLFLSALFQTPIEADELNYDADADLCNKRGLTPLGAYLVNTLIDRGMLIEVDHASFDAANEILNIAEAREYSGVIASHNWTHSTTTSIDDLGQMTERILELGGFASMITDPAMQARMLNAHNYVTQNTNFLAGIGIGSDFSGLHPQPAPGNEDFYGNVDYPYVSEFGFEFDKQESGERIWDYNTDGLAHYGMLADFIQDTRINQPAVYESLMNSAEAYLQTWERAEANTNTEYVNFAPPQVSITARENLADPDNRTCMDVQGQRMTLVDNLLVRGKPCRDFGLDQQWIYNSETKELQNMVDTKFCLNRLNFQLRTLACDAQEKAQGYWHYFDNRLASASNQQSPLLLRGDSNRNEAGVQRGIRVAVRSFGTDSQWILRPSSDYNRPVMFHAVAGSGKCLGFTGINTRLEMQRCEGKDYQHWYYNIQTNTIHTQALNKELCMQVREATPRDGSRIDLADCNPSDTRQQFSREGLLFASIANRNLAIDNGGGAREPVMRRLNADNRSQQWVAGLSFRTSNNFYAPSSIANVVGSNDRGWLADLSCEASEVLVGVSGRVGWAIDQVGVVCARTDDTGNWIGNFEAPLDAEFQGGNGGNPFFEVCPAGQSVASLDVWQGYRSNSNNVGGIRLGCRDLSARREVTGRTTSGNRVGITNTNFAGTSQCTGNNAASGLAGRFEGPFNRLALKCYN
ncbi:ricin-type beta-trefoil lectin domain protein [Pseudomonadales bacterium]|nr:ricin-type beta-trefoil lectin domain protein [Pseudomonadales bacterium]